jgi:hypothetical protein
MDNPVDSTIVDLGLVNYVQHPSNPNYIVYRFPDPERAASFESELNRLGIWFEKDEEQTKSRTYTLFGVHKKDYKQVTKLNIQVEGKHKKPLIPHKGFRYFIVAFGMIAIILAVIGSCKQQNKLASYNEEDVSVNAPN